MRRKLAAMALAIGVITVFAGPTVAGHLASSVTNYTGCLVSKDGVIIKIKAGESPSSPCSGGMVQVHFSGGDITSVAVQAGGGLTGGGSNGTVSLSIRRDCANGQIVKWDGIAWTCAADDNMAYTAGTGLDLTGSELSVEEGYRLPQDCAGGEAATRNPATGGGAATWTCDQFAQADQACASGQFAKGVTAIGTLNCSTPSAGAPAAFQASASTRILEDQNSHEVVRLQLPSGRYAVYSTGDVYSADLGNIDVFGVCSLEGPLAIDFSSYSFEGSSVALGGIFTLNAPGAISVECSALGEDPSQADFEIVAIAVS